MDSLLYQHRKYLESQPKAKIEAITKYTGGHFDTINEGLRNKTKLSTQDEYIVSSIDRIFMTIPPTEVSLTVYRGINVDNQDAIALSNMSFISTSYEKASAANFSGTPCCLLILTIPVGSKVICLESLSHYKEEREVLLDRGGSFSISGIKVGKFTEVLATYIPKNAVNLKSLDSVVAVARKTEDDVENIIKYISKEDYDEYLEFDSLEVLINQIAERNQIKVTKDLLSIIKNKLSQKFK